MISTIQIYTLWYSLTFGVRFNIRPKNFTYQCWIVTIVKIFLHLEIIGLFEVFTSGISLYLICDVLVNLEPLMRPLKCHSWEKLALGASIKDIPKMFWQYLTPFPAVSSAGV